MAYRCHICRLELVLDEETDRLTVAPIPGEHKPDKSRRQTP
jgi:hypothetical protein